MTKAQNMKGQAFIYLELMGEQEKKATSTAPLGCLLEPTHNPEDIGAVLCKMAAAEVIPPQPWARLAAILSSRK